MGVHKVTKGEFEKFSPGNKELLHPETGARQKQQLYDQGNILYGNYDGENQQPVFDLYLGVNAWTTVNLTNADAFHYYYYDVIHVPLTDYIDVCLVNTSHGVPFISSLELRHLDNSIYKTEGGALAKISGYDVGRNRSENTFRYPNDTYDRFWNPLLFEEWIPIATDSTVYSLSNGNAYNIPDVVLKTAAKTQNASIPLSLYFSPPDSLSKCYVYFHFAEIEKLEAGQQRELKINLNGERDLGESFKLDYLNVLTVAPNNPPITGERLHFTINAAEGNKLPPILNAVEMFVLKELPNRPTAIEDVEAIMKIKKLYRVTRNWQGDPCVPIEYSWDGLNCSYNNPPSIISLNLSSSNLTGEIASSFSNLIAVQSLDLSYNNLTGLLPEFLAQLSNLNTLNVSGNRLTGSVPEALLQKFRDGKLVLSVGENPDLCLSVPCKRKKKKEFVIPVVASSIAAVLVLLFIFPALAVYRRKRQGGMVTKSNIKLQNQQYSYSEVVSITNNFNTIIGGGGFGKVYLGKLKDETQVAVKLLSTTSNQGYKEFQAEAQLLMIVHHRNLVSLVGYCDENDRKALIYEYMANGNLHQHLSAGTTHKLESAQPKSINAQLNKQAVRMACFSQTNGAPNSEIWLPEQYQASGNFSKKSDVYSFGIVMFELITGRPAIIRGPEKNTHILDWVYPIIESGDIQNVVDPRLQGEFHTNSAWKAVEIAMSCIPPIAIQRPDMSEVLTELKECLALVMAHGKSQRMETEGNETTSGIPLMTTYLEFDSDIAALARYPNDVYDRYWRPLQIDGGTPITTNSTIYSQSNNDAYNIPDVVLRTAAKTQNTSVPLTLYWNPPDSFSKCYVYFHFAEIEKLEAGQQRELKINLNGERNLIESVKLDYLNPQTIVQNDPPISGQQIYFSIYAAEGTKHPPILNAFETVVLKDLPNNPTAIDDVEAIMDIKELYRVAKNWQGDPCVPSEFSWDGLNCSNNSPPRIISLSSFFLNDKQELELKQFDRRDCNFILQSESTAVLYSNELPSTHHNHVIPIPCNFAKAPVPEIFNCDIQSTVTKSNIKSQDQQYSYSEVVSITNNFKTIIGGGGFGNVYLGKLKDKTQVAVQFLSTPSNQGYKEFQAEAQLLMIVHHRNLVSLFGYCDEGEKKALIYEFMANGNLHQHLSVTNRNVLTWNERLHIAVDAAHGLEYLHNGCKPPIIHRDLKPSNILLNEHMQAKIADFGLSRAFATESDSHVSTRPAGTLGYLDPEFQASGNFNKKSDVYSFGIILFELITGRPAIVRGPVQNNHILDWVKPLIERGDVQNVVDPRLEGEFSTSSAWKAIEIAMSCIPSAAIQRPDMSHVLAELKECLALEMGRGRIQSMTTEGNNTIASIPFKMTHLEYESDIAPHAR
uniref:non-specific serine/threonine protein kinase n=1 Tax=Fagus sylvatica TaxID=28930 RepID=A0A2N9FWU6_FAGSY